MRNQPPPRPAAGPDSPPPTPTGPAPRSGTGTGSGAGRSDLAAARPGGTRDTPARPERPAPGAASGSGSGSGSGATAAAPAEGTAAHPDPVDTPGRGPRRPGAEAAGNGQPVEVGRKAPRQNSLRSRQDLLSRTALGVFRLNGQFLAFSEELARPAGLTAAWWQVLGAVLHEPLSVAGIARAMGITRQSVQRIADLLAAKGLAEYVPNPAHRRAKLLRPTDAGLAAVARIDPGHAALATRLAEALGEDGFAEAVRTLERLSAALDTLPPPPDSAAP